MQPGTSSGSCTSCKPVPWNKWSVP